MDDHAVQAAAAMLWDLWTTGERVSELPPDVRPVDLDEAWAIQRAIDAHAAPRAGWKVAASSKAAQALLGVDGPLVGALYERQLVPDGAAVPAPAIEVAEAEFVFRMNADLLPGQGPFGRAAVLAGVGSIHPAIEVPDSRLSSYPRVSAPQMVADIMCGGYLVVGSALRGVDLMGLGSVDVVLRRDGVDVARGSGAEVLGDPCEALVWLANEVTRRGEVIRTGDVITTGACAVIHGVGAGDRISASFGPSGDVAVSLASPSPVARR